MDRAQWWNTCLTCERPSAQFPVLGSYLLPHIQALFLLYHILFFIQFKIFLLRCLPLLMCYVETCYLIYPCVLEFSSYVQLLTSSSSLLWSKNRHCMIPYSFTFMKVFMVSNVVFLGEYSCQLENLLFGNKDIHRCQLIQFS